MRIDFAVRRGRRLSLTSLIDVIFLLLLFFMLSSTFTRFAEVEISGGTAGLAASRARPDVVITLAGENWRINGAAATAETAGSELARLAGAGAKSAVILVREDVTSQTLVSAVETVRHRSGLSVTVAR